MKRLLGLCATAVLALAACRGGMQNLPSASGFAAGQGSASASAFRVAERANPFGADGSSNTVTADMPVPHPDTKPCSVTLFSNDAFKDFTPQNFSFAPPSACKGPWGAVVLTFDVSVTKGIQFDRTGIIWLDGSVIYFGTTAEPSPSLAPHWSVQRDVTNLSALFEKSSQGQIALGNVVNSTYNGVIHGTATLQFYPPSTAFPAPRVPDVVVGLPYSPPLGASAHMPMQPLAVATTLPRNVTAATLSVFLQSQHTEEQWFMCVPWPVYTGSKHALGFCGDTAFREGEVRIDGMPAGTAPVFPWIYTGGLDPDLWAPIPGVQTLGFAPFDVDLTPFAGTLDDGKEHTISVLAHNAYSYFTGAGNLLLYLDPKSKTVSGKLTRDTLSMVPDEHVTTNVKGSSGTVGVTSARDYTIAGYVEGSSGRVDTTVSVKSSFSNQQTLATSSSSYEQLVDQDTQWNATITTTPASGSPSVSTESYDYPLTVSYPLSATSKGYKLPLSIYQSYRQQIAMTGSAPFSLTRWNTVVSKDTMIFDKSFNWINALDGASTQLYTYKDSTGICYGRQLASVQNKITADTMPGCGAKPAPQPSPKP